MSSNDRTPQGNSKPSTLAGSSTNRRPDRAKPAIGRYDGRSHNTRLPAEGLGKAPKSMNAAPDHMAVAAIEDPWGNGRERLYATINRRVDVLEDERSHKLITEAAYRTGRQVQAVFELAARIGGSNWAGSSHVDPRHAQSSAIARAMERAEEILAMERRIRDRLGEIDMRLLARVLRDRMSFADCAALVGKAGPWGERYVKTRFRHALEDLADAWTATGKGRPVPDDKHKAAAVDVDAREAASIAAGATARREARVTEDAARALKTAPAQARRQQHPRGARGR